MPYIGNTVQNQGFAPAIDYFSGNGVTVTFTLSRPVASVAQIICAIDNVIQNPSSAFNVSGNSITFTSAPLSGTNNIWVEYTSLITTYQGISQDPSVIGDITATGGFLSTGDFGNSFIDGNLVDYVTGRGRVTVGELDNITFYHGGTGGRSEMMDLYYAGGAKIYGTTALTIPVGTTAQRPISPAVGMQRWNSTLGAMEYYNGTSWSQSFLLSYGIDYLIVAGGGGGASCGGGGGAGGYIASNATISSGASYAITVGAGGSGSSTGNNSTQGSSSILAGAGITGGTAIGGGAAAGNNTGGGFSGGSGGGAGSAGSTGGGAGGSGTAGQGNAGGNGNSGSSNYGAGGGGGAGAVGGNGTNSNGGNGGAGLNWQSLGTFYAGGGGGGIQNSATGGNGGSGGGGAGRGDNGTATAGTANTGGGGGGGGYASAYGTGGAGGSGVVIIRYAGAQKGSGGTVTSSGGYTYHTFTSSGTYTA